METIVSKLEDPPGGGRWYPPIMRWWLCALACGCGAASMPTGDSGVPDLGAPADLTDPCAGGSDGFTCVRDVTGQVIDPAGSVPVTNLITSVCAGICWFGQPTGADGRFDVAVDQAIDYSIYALMLHGRPTHATYYVALPAGGQMNVAYAQPLPLPALPTSGPVLDGSQLAVTSGDVTVNLQSGTKVLPSVEDVANGAIGKELLAITVAPASMPFFVGTTPPDALYGFSPFEVSFDKPAALAFVNTGMWPAGTAVDVSEMRGLVNDAPPAGPFVHVATAHVSADGTQVVTDPGQGVLELTWIALRKM